MGFYTGGLKQQPGDLADGGGKEGGEKNAGTGL